jgi:hypothetical protein
VLSFPSGFWLNAGFDVEAGMSSGSLCRLWPNAFTAAAAFALLTMCAAPACGQVVLSPDRLLFHCIADQQCAPETTTLKNLGRSSVTLSSITVTGDFLLTNDCGEVLKPGESCSITLTFNPAKAGRVTGALTVDDSAPNSPQIALLKAITEGGS